MATTKMLTLLLAGALASGPIAASAAEEVTTATEPAPPAAAPRLPLLGLNVDAGLPDGMNASLIVRPWRWVRGEVGGGYNLISPGVRAGVTLAPFGWGPSATLEAGHYFEGNANGLARKFAGSDFKDSALLERIGYDYANAHLGFEFGYRRMTFFIHGGMSIVRGKLHNADSVVQEQGGAVLGAGSTVVVKQDPSLKAVVPSAKMGVIVYVW
jgi:hypothetical protein